MPIELKCVPIDLKKITFLAFYKFYISFYLNKKKTEQENNCITLLLCLFT